MAKIRLNGSLLSISLLHIRLMVHCHYIALKAITERKIGQI